MANNRKILETVINITGEISPTLGKSLDKLTKNINDTHIKIAAAAAGATAALAGTGAAIVKLRQLGDNYKTAVNDMAAATGATGAELEGLKDVMTDVYAAGYGESMEDVSKAIIEVSRNTGLAGEELEKVTEGAIALSDTFEYDVTESSRAAKAMMTNFGISGEEALSMIAAGAQNGLDYSGELIDSINEYSVQFAKLGFSADDMFQIFQAGADSGAWNLDKVGDAIKEFSIRSIDGSKTTTEAFEALGLNSAEMMTLFANGGEGAEAAFKQVSRALIDVDDKVQRDAIGVQLFGTMWEDLGVEAMTAIANVEGGTYDVGNALDGINEIKFDSFGAAMESIKRTLEVALLPAAEKVANAIIKAQPIVMNLLEDVTPMLSSVASAAEPVVQFTVTGLGWLVDHGDIVIGVIGGITTAVGLYKGAQMLANLSVVEGTAAITASNIALGIRNGTMTVATAVSGGLTTATTALGAAIKFMTGPIGIAITVIGALVGAGIYLWKNWDTVKIKAAELGDYLGNKWADIKNGVGNMVAGIKDFFVTGFSSLVGIVKAPINGVIGIINGAIDGINSIGFEIPDWVPAIGGKEFAINIPKLPMLAKGGFTDGVSIAGEAGQEAVISFDPSYREQNLSYWAKAGRMLGATADDAALLSTGGVSYGTTYSLGNITYAPQISASGKMDMASLRQLLREDKEEFFDMLEEFFAEREARSYGTSY